jgi:hypothetical protein
LPTSTLTSRSARTQDQQARIGAWRRAPADPIGKNPLKPWCHRRAITDDDPTAGRLSKDEHALHAAQ